MLGNAGEFLDPVFSSGVTIAFASSSLAARGSAREFNGEHVDWQKDYAAPLMVGVNTFRVFVKGWYDGGFQDVGTISDFVGHFWSLRFKFGHFRSPFSGVISTHRTMT